LDVKMPSTSKPPYHFAVLLDVYRDLAERAGRGDAVDPRLRRRVRRALCACVGTPVEKIDWKVWIMRAFRWAFYIGTTLWH
jgi:hypothetical protein